MVIYQDKGSEGATKAFPLGYDVLEEIQGRKITLPEAKDVENDISKGELCGYQGIARSGKKLHRLEQTIAKRQSWFLVQGISR